ncbi:FxsA family protein [Parvibaculum sedimenti]|uniref:FxsA family protein n=1 Tax=Parvibaculum sedimenti TaxID=2608632 RepID=UPI001639926F|nr:FxsA family protein [Parvibaculum sedimenti]
MAPVILLALILVPLAEIATFIWVGGWIGALPTVALVVGLAILGLWLLHHQGLGTLRKAQEAMDRGEMPVEQVTDGAFIVLAGLLMVTPGLLTDALGLLLLVPAVRRALGRAVTRWARTHMHVQGMGASASYTRYSGPIIEGKAEAIEPEPDDANAKKGDGPSPWIGGGRSN